MRKLNKRNRGFTGQILLWMCVTVCKRSGELFAKSAHAQQKPSLDETKKVKNICVAVISVLFEHLTTDAFGISVTTSWISFNMKGFFPFFLRLATLQGGMMLERAK